MKKEYIAPEIEALYVEFFNTNDSNELPFLPANW